MGLVEGQAPGSPPASGEGGGAVVMSQRSWACSLRGGIKAQEGEHRRTATSLTLDKLSLRKKGRAHGDIQQIRGSREGPIWDHLPSEQEACMKPRPSAGCSVTPSITLDPCSLYYS